MHSEVASPEGWTETTPTVTVCVKCAGVAMLDGEMMRIPTMLEIVQMKASPDWKLIELLRGTIEKRIRQQAQNPEPNYTPKQGRL